MSRNVVALCTSCLPALVAAAACMPQQAKGPATDEQMQTVTYSMPQVTSVETGKESQARGGVTVSVVPLPFKTSDTPSKTCAPIDQSKSSSLLGGLINVNSSDPNAKKQYQITTQTGVDFKPKSLTFKLHVVNQTDHVLRLGGVELRLNVNDNEVELSDTALDKFHKTNIVPGEEKTFNIEGPDWSHNKEQSTIDFGMFGLPLTVDQNGNGTGLENFHWTYQAKLVTTTTQTKKTVETMALSPAEAQSIGCPVGPATATAAK
ncbi:MAG TPA: hypothetical protein VHC69_29115 [Polyangiaceae bacterium]|nr:hypothetical protein [Polyangiaceae bacterium]